MIEGFSLIDMVRDLGLTVCLVIFFVWQTAKREERMGKRINELEEYVRGELVETLKATALTISRNTEVMERLDRDLPRPPRGSWVPPED